MKVRVKCKKAIYLYFLLYSQMSFAQPYLNALSKIKQIFHAGEISRSIKPFATLKKSPKFPIGYSKKKLLQLFKSNMNLLRGLTFSNGPLLNKYRNLGSGGNTPMVFKNKNLAKFFKQIFLKISKDYPDITLDPLNLFHGHFIYSKSQGFEDLILVFHAYEYPLDLEPWKVKKVKDQFLSIKKFSTSNANFKRRNLIWSLKANSIIRLNTSKRGPFNPLIRSEAYNLFPKEVNRANTIQESFFGKRILDLNFFIDEKGGGLSFRNRITRWSSI